MCVLVFVVCMVHGSWFVVHGSALHVQHGGRPAKVLHGFHVHGEERGFKRQAATGQDQQARTREEPRYCTWKYIYTKYFFFFQRKKKHFIAVRSENFPRNSSLQTACDTSRPSMTLLYRTDRLCKILGGSSVRNVSHLGQIIYR